MTSFELATKPDLIVQNLVAHPIKIHNTKQVYKKACYLVQ